MCLSCAPRALLIGVLLSILGGVGPQVGWAQDSTELREEGRVLNQASGRIYYFRVRADSTVLIRQVRPSSSTPGVEIPASTLDMLFKRVEQQALDREGFSDRLTLHYEDQSLVLGVTKQFNLYIAGALLFVIIVGGGLLLWLWGRLATEQRRRADLARSRQYLAEGREKERKRLAQELHDGPVQDLHGLHMHLKSLAAQADGQLENVGNELMRVTGDLRAMSADLHPPALQQFGLAAALRSHADRLEERSADVTIDLDLPNDEPDVPDEIALSLFRIAQEAMNNAVQHGEADHIQVRFDWEDEVVDFEVTDDGKGFSPPEEWHVLASEDHYGLLGMQERAEAIGADLEIDTEQGNGTRVHVEGRTRRPSS